MERETAGRGIALPDPRCPPRSCRDRRLSTGGLSGTVDGRPLRGCRRAASQGLSTGGLSGGRGRRLALVLTRPIHGSVLPWIGFRGPRIDLRGKSAETATRGAAEASLKAFGRPPNPHLSIARRRYGIRPVFLSSAAGIFRLPPPEFFEFRRRNPSTPPPEFFDFRRRSFLSSAAGIFRLPPPEFLSSAAGIRRRRRLSRLTAPLHGDVRRPPVRFFS